MSQNKSNVEETSEEVLDNEKNEQSVESETEQKDQVEGSSEEAEDTKDDHDEKDAKIQELEAKLEEANSRFLRAQADFDNFRRRAKQEREASQKYRSQNLLEDLLPALDNFERALAVEANDDSTKSLIQGMEMVYRQILDAMKKEGLEEIEAKGNEFDPHFHQAVMQVEDSDFDSNIVVEELQKGYKLKDRVIRPSMVKVNQ